MSLPIQTPESVNSNAGYTAETIGRDIHADHVNRDQG
jgi:hypothetical protein